MYFKDQHLCKLGPMGLRRNFAKRNISQILLFFFLFLLFFLVEILSQMEDFKDDLIQ